MSGISAKDTRPELRVRRYLHAGGFRYRLHGKDLPGRPDIILPRFRSLIFVHGCFWHQHPGCRFAYMPKSNRAFWDKKLGANVIRDRAIVRRLRRMGWRVRIVWECDVANERQLTALAKWITTGLGTLEEQRNEFRPRQSKK
jgi:DNA mismatch endonuclease (patch repair protein)